MKKKVFKFFSVISLLLLLCAAAVMGIADYITPDNISCYKGKVTSGNDFVVLAPSEDTVSVSSESSFIRTTKMTAKVFGVIPLKEVNVNSYDNMSLYAGGFPFGVKFNTDGIVVVSLQDVPTEKGNVNPAYAAGIRENDIITKCNGIRVTGAEELTSLIERSEGKTLTLSYLRENAEYIVSLTPVLSSEDGSYKTGMWIRDSGAGIGTVTFINPRDNSFGGLGHGICDAQTGSLIPFSRGNIMEVSLSGVVKGVPGEPGELKGYFGGRKLGAVLINTGCGVFGVYSKLPREASELYPIGLKEEIKSGPATVICTVDNDGIGKYDIEISAVNLSSSSDSNKCFTVRVTDSKLIEKTGGIVQGMSGSPIIQNGKIVGAVTHVMVGDPTVGYGIFIENMLSKCPDILK